MLDTINVEKVLFIDIETVPEANTYGELSAALKPFWDKKSEFMRRNGESPEELYAKAGIYAEFAKVICISAGFIVKEKSGYHFRLKSFYGHDEHQVLSDFAELLNKSFNRKEFMFCAHNGKEFDYPFLSRRMLIHGIKLPKLLNNAGKKPWEVNHLDTMELWRFGDFKSYTSLNLLAAIFNIPTPKDEMEGSDVRRVYYEEKDLEKIRTYCQKDVLTVARLFLRYRSEGTISDEQVSILG
jgi:3'-5' exonuclease